MARFKGQNTEKIYEAAHNWRDECLLKSGSLLWPEEGVWTTENLQEFKAQFIDRPDEDSQKDFETKLKAQLNGGSKGVYKISAELLLVHFLFTSSLKGPTKISWLEKVSEWGEVKFDNSLKILDSLNAGIGGTGEAYNRRRWKELEVLGLFALELVQKSPEDRALILDDHLKTREIFENIEEDSGRTQTPHIILHLLFPDKYERIASTNHKYRIIDAFGGLIDDDGDNIDDNLLVIRNKLKEMLDKVPEVFDFYRPPLMEVWWTSSTVPQELDPLTGLRNKKQVVLYGPPGTGKTFEANETAKTLIRQSILRLWQPAKYFQELNEVEGILKKRIRKVQFHPGYGYEEFVRGLQLGEHGETVYRDGVLLEALKYISNDSEEFREIPFVLILDEMNRADLSRVLGECFSLLENRNDPITLAGHGGTPIEIPENLFLIGTMNLIDQSLEQVDFALRRRFLWFLREYSKEDFINISKYRWDRLIEQGEINKRWSFDYLSDEFDILATRAEEVNRMIAEYHNLGEQFEIGHTYFADIVDFLKIYVQNRKQRGRMLFNIKGRWREPVQQLWQNSVKPLIEQYLSGEEANDRLIFLKGIESQLEKGTSD